MKSQGQDDGWIGICLCDDVDKAVRWRSVIQPQQSPRFCYMASFTVVVSHAAMHKCKMQTRVASGWRGPDLHNVKEY